MAVSFLPVALVCACALLPFVTAQGKKILVVPRCRYSLRNFFQASCHCFTPHRNQATVLHHPSIITTRSNASKIPVVQEYPNAARLHEATSALCLAVSTYHHLPHPINLPELATFLAQPPKGTSQPCGGLNEQWESCTTPCPASCEYSSPYETYPFWQRGWNYGTYFNRNPYGGCASCIAGCSCIAGHLRERLQGGSACVPAAGATCVVNVGQPGLSYPFDWFAR